ncbi:unnamed protein product [Dovyalis caffra]|uniref:Uncharacterized protein n=1 Tax=Dovyalis caffra TaxID=77055 RepID=A0AAV1RFI9_9ROSI|nr:unnamed protein product [Dovyalis caffra]
MTNCCSACSVQGCDGGCLGGAAAVEWCLSWSCFGFEWRGPVGYRRRGWRSAVAGTAPVVGEDGGFWRQCLKRLCWLGRQRWTEAEAAIGGVAGSGCVGRVCGQRLEFVVYGRRCLWSAT